MSGNKRNLSRKRRRKRNKNNNMCSAPRPFRHEKQEDEPSGDPPSPDQSDEEDVKYAIRLSQLSYQSPAVDYKQKGVIVSNPLKPTPRWKPESTYELGESSTASNSCSTCEDAHPTGVAMLRINECGHIYCLGCVPDFLGGQIKDLTNITQVKCADSKCKTTIPYEHCRSYVPEEVMERWKAAKAESSVLWYPFKFRCPFVECGEEIVDDERGFKIRACPFCWRVFCVSCRVKWHLGKSCKAFQEEMELERKRQEEMELERKRQEEMELERERKEGAAKILGLIEILNQTNEEIQKMEQEAEAIDEFNSRRFGSNLRRRSIWDKDYEEELQRAARMEELQQKRQMIQEALVQEHRRLFLEDGNSGHEGRFLLFRFV